jgi:hypothetical protein
MVRYRYSGRTDQTKAALKRWLDAEALRKERRWRGAMYVAGYVIECKLKASLMEIYDLDTLEELDAELERRLGKRVDVFTHSIEVLFNLTNARDRMIGNSKGTSVLRAFQLCNTWHPAWRYRPDDGSEPDCAAFMSSVKEFRDFIDHNL